MSASGRNAAALPTFATVKSYVATLWDESQLFGTLNDERRRIDGAIEASLWQHIAAETAGTSGAESAGLAQRFAEAWLLEHSYGDASASSATVPHANNASGELYRAARQLFMEKLRTENAISAAELPRSLARQWSFDRPHRYQHCIETPFFSRAKSEFELLSKINVKSNDALSNWATANIADHTKYECADPRSERNAAIAWADRMLSQRREARHERRASQVAIVVPDLASTRGVWERALLEARLPFNLSLGLAVSKYPWAAVGFTLVSAMFSPNAPETIAQALRHPRWGRSHACNSAIGRREIELLASGVAATTLFDFCRVSNRVEGDELANLSARLREIEPSFRASSLNTRAHWKRVFERAIELLTEAPPAIDSSTYQLRAALQNAIDTWCELDRWLPRVSASIAQQELVSLTDRSPFQPEGSDAPVQVIGLLESAGVPFDAMWVTGLTERALPEAQRANPFLSAAWQKAQSAGLASIEECEARAARLVQGWRSLSGVVTASKSKKIDDEPQLWSPLIAAWLDVEHAEMARSVPNRERGSLVVEHDESALAWQSPSRRGVRALEAQANCPRRGFAEGRLRLSAWPTRSDGLSAQVRGELIHEIAEQLGRALQASPMDFGALLAVLPFELDRCIDGAQRRFSHVPEHIWQAEHARLQSLFEQFIDAESKRRAFTVAEVEQKVSTSISGLDFSLRIDRIDYVDRTDADTGELSQSALAVIDFKSGNVDARGLYDERLTAPQLPLYAHALTHVPREPMSAPVHAVAYARVHDDHQNLVSFGTPISGLAAAPRSKAPMWDELSASWLPKLETLANELLAGEAMLAPAYGRATCNKCDFQRFCRVDFDAMTADESAEESQASTPDRASP